MGTRKDYKILLFQINFRIISIGICCIDDVTLEHARCLSSLKFITCEENHEKKLTHKNEYLNTWQLIQHRELSFSSKVRISGFFVFFLILNFFFINFSDNKSHLPISFFLRISVKSFHTDLKFGISDFSCRMIYLRHLEVQWRNGYQHKK